MLDATSPSDAPQPARDRVQPPIVMYWRPGCGFCAALDRRMTGAGLVFERRNIWENPDDAAFVRSVARGNETVPTLVVNGISMVNPSLDAVIAALN